jgi:hypothetical protein
VTDETISFESGATDGLRRLRTVARVLTGGAVVAAAIAVPEFSVGAGDLAKSVGPTDPPEPAATKAGRGLTQTLARPLRRTEGLGAASAARAFAAPPSASAAVAAKTTSARLLAQSEPAAIAAPSLPVQQADAALAASTPASDALAAAPGIAGDPQAAPLPAMPSLPQVDARSPAMVAPIASPEAAQPLSGNIPEPAPLAAAPSADFAALLPEEQAALRAPVAAASAPLPVAMPAAQPAGLAPLPATVSAPASAPEVGMNGDRGGIQQLAPRPRAPVTPGAALAPTAPAARAMAAPSPAVRAPSPTAAATPPAAARPAPAPLVAAAAKPSPALAAPPAASAPQIRDIRAQLLTRVDGRATGRLDFQQSAAGLKVRLGSVAEVLADRIAPAELQRIRNSPAGQTWLSLAELRAQGVPISYDPVYDEFNIGTADSRPKNADKVHIDQIGAPRSGIVTGR